MIGETKLLKVGSVDVLNRPATADFVTDEVEHFGTVVWGLTVDTAGITGGPPQVTIEVSNDKINWHGYSADAANVPIPEFIFDDIWPSKYWRVNYSANGATAGTITMRLKRTD